MNLSVAKRLGFGFAAVMLVTVILSIIGISAANRLSNMMSDMYDNNLIPIADVANANMEAIYHNRSLYDYVIETDKPAMNQIAITMDKHKAKMKALLDKYRKTNLTDREVDLLKKLDVAWPIYEANAKKVMAYSYADDNKGAMLEMNGDATKNFQIVDDLLSAIVNVNVELSKNAHEGGKTTAAKTQNLAIGLMLGGLLLSSGIGYFISRSLLDQLGGEPKYAQEVMHRIALGDLSFQVELERANDQSLMASINEMQKKLSQLINQIKSSAMQVTTYAREVAVAIEQVSVSSSQQSESSTIMAAAIEELTVSIDQVASNASDAQRIAGSSGKCSDEGAAQVNDATQEITKIALTVQETTSQMSTLREKSQQISSIASVIRDVADQTNLLALNAAIEAARAGEQGRGFAVVADEVRKLAERTTSSAQEITNMITSIQGQTDKVTATIEQGNVRVAEGVALAKRAGESMNLIGESSQGVMSAVTDITNALMEQKMASSEIAKQVEKIASMSEENSLAVSNVATTAVHLNALSDNLQKSVSSFKV